MELIINHNRQKGVNNVSVLVTYSIREFLIVATTWTTWTTGSILRCLDILCRCFHPCHGPVNINTNDLFNRLTGANSPIPLLGR